MVTSSLHVHGPLSVGGERGPAGDEALDNVTVCAFYILNALGVINTSSMTSLIFSFVDESIFKFVCRLRLRIKIKIKNLN